MTFFYYSLGQRQRHSYLNSTNSNLTLSLDFFLTEIHFLNLKISGDDSGDLHTSIFRKPSDCKSILKADSLHLPWLLDKQDISIRLYPQLQKKAKSPTRIQLLVQKEKQQVYSVIQCSSEAKRIKQIIKGKK